MTKKDYPDILQEAYDKASDEIKKDDGKSFLQSLQSEKREWITSVAESSEDLKAVTSVLTTSLVKKIQDPNQDVRNHKHALKAGYSGRTLDTNFITPFFKKKFRRFAMKESGWLTRSLEQPHPFTLDFPGKINNYQTKRAFLSVLNDIEEKKADPKKYLIALFILLIKNTQLDLSIQQPVITHNLISINAIIECLANHFFYKYECSGASRLPVVAIYSIYQMLLNDVARFKSKKLLPIRSHISSDVKSKGIGDIEIIDENGKYFEAVEIKHGMPINSIMIEDAFEKFKVTPIRRYYLLTTAQPNIKLFEQEAVKKVILEIRKNIGCEVIVNGIIPSLKYYLRLIQEPNKFLENYTKNLAIEFNKTTEIKKEHIEVWRDMIKILS